MTVRPYQKTDQPILDLLARSAGHPYPDPSRPEIEVALVVLDDGGNIVMACAAERIVQLYLWADPVVHPAAKLHALRLLHRDMAPALKTKGYNSVEAYLPPKIAAQFGKRLERTFRWIRNWPSWTKAF